MPSETTSIIYAGDPLCSWCWGIANELQLLIEELDIPFNIVLGGLRPGTEHQLKDEERSMIRHHWVEVNKRTGQPINFDLMDKKIPFVYDTEKPCRAVVAIRNVDSSLSFPFFKAIQKKFYVDNIDTNKVEVYGELASDFGIDQKVFFEKFNSEEIKKETNDDFLWCRNTGANSFPTVILNFNSQFYAIAIGYATHIEMLARSQEIMSKK